MKKLLALLIVAFVFVPSTALAHGGPPVITADIYDGGVNRVGGWGNVDFSAVHDTAYITVQIQRSWSGTSWVNNGSAASKSLTNVDSIYKQVVADCPSGTTQYYRVKIFYRFTEGGNVHQDTVYKGQERHWCT